MLSVLNLLREPHPSIWAQRCPHSEEYLEKSPGPAAVGGQWAASLGDMSHQQGFQGNKWGCWAEKAPGPAAASGVGEQAALPWRLCHEGSAQAEPGLSILVAPVKPPPPPRATCSLTSPQVRNCVPAGCRDGIRMAMGMGLSGSGQCLKGWMEPVGGTGVRPSPPTLCGESYQMPQRCMGAPGCYII